MEAFVVAMLNGRAAVLEYMVSRGFNVDSLVYGSPVINVAVGNGMTADGRVSRAVRRQSGPSRLATHAIRSGAGAGDVPEHVTGSQPPAHRRALWHGP